MSTTLHPSTYHPQAHEAADAATSARHPMALIVTEDEAASLLRLSARTLQRLRLDGGGPAFVRLTPSGSRIGYSLAALHEYVAGRSVASTSAATVAKSKAGAR